MSGTTLPTIEQLQFFLSQLSTAQTALATAQTAFTSAQSARDAAAASLGTIVAAAQAQFNGVIAGTSQPTAQDLQTSLQQIGNAQATLATAQVAFVQAEQTLIPVQTQFNQLVTNARAEFSQIFGS